METVATAVAASAILIQERPKSDHGEEASDIAAAAAWKTAARCGSAPGARGGGVQDDRREGVGGPAFA